MKVKIAQKIHAAQGQKKNLDGLYEVLAPVSTLNQYIDRRPVEIQEKTVEQKVINHKKFLLRKSLGSKKSKRNRKQLADVSFFSSRRICVSSKIVRASKMGIPIRNPKHDDAIQNWPDLTQILHCSPPVPIAAPPTQPNVVGKSISQSTPSARQLTPILRKENKGIRSIQVSDISDSNTSWVRRSKPPIQTAEKDLPDPIHCA